MKSFKRGLALMMTACMLMTGTAFAEEQTDDTVLPAQETAAPVTEATSTPAPPAEHTPEPETPQEEPTPAATDVPPTEQPPTEQPPTEVPPTELPPAEETTPAASEQPAEATPLPEVTDTPTEAPWDESLCDHANEHCEQAPACLQEGCTHIGTDANGLPYPLCKKGAWILDRQDELLRAGVQPMVMERTVRTHVIDLNLGDAVLYRSGSYTVKGGDMRGGKLTVAKNRVVVLLWNEMLADVVSLGMNAQATLSMIGVNTVGELNLAENAALEVLDGGALTVGSVTGAGMDNLTLRGGSVALPGGITDKNGRHQVNFDAPGMTAVTVDGAVYMANCPYSGDVVSLWLNEPIKGTSYTAKMNGTTLEVVSTPAMPADVTDVAAGSQLTAEAGKTYRMQGGGQDATRLTVDAENVTVVLDGVTGKVDTLIAATKPVTVLLEGQTDVTGLLMNSASAVTLTGGGTLAAGSLAADSLTVKCPRLALTDEASMSSWGYRAITVPDASALASASAMTLDGVAVPLVVTLGAPNKLYVNSSDDSIAVDAVTDGVVIARTGAAVGAKQYYTSDSPLVIGETDVIVSGGGTAHSGGITLNAPSAKTAEFSGVQVTGGDAGLTVSGGDAVITLLGDNLLDGTTASVIPSAGASVTLDAASGRLLLKNQRDTNGLILKGNIKLEPEPTLPHTVVRVKDQNGNAIPNTAVTLSVEGKTYRFITQYDSTLHLWGMGALTGRDIAVTDGKKVYTAVIVDGAAEATDGLTISDVQLLVRDDGTLPVTFTCPGAKSVGVQYVVGTAGQKLADTFVDKAQRQTGANGRVTLTGLTNGQVVSLRVYASSMADAILTADTADGFQFSDVYTMTIACRIPYPVDQDANVVFTGKAYKNPLIIPADAAVTYTGEHLNTQGMPVRVGDYIMHITIPEGNAVYLPGTCDIPFRVTRIPLYIIPEPNQFKFEGEEDPELWYDVKGLMAGDEVTGELTREEGEEVGNYAFRLNKLIVSEYYQVKLIAGASVFTILPGGGGGVVIFSEMLHPVRQEIVRADNRRVAVVLNTQDVLTVNHSRIGSVMFSTEDDRMRPVSPSLSWNQQTDEVLLRIRAEAELNKDGGYVTDEDGNPLWGGRYFRMSWLALRNLHNIGVDAISISNEGAALTLRLDELLGTDMQAWIKSAGGDLTTARIKLELIPVEQTADTGEAAAIAEASPASSLYRMRALLVIGRTELDMTDRLTTLTAAVDMEPVARLLESMNRYDEAAFPTRFAMRSLTGDGVSWAVNPLEAAFITPFMPDEMTRVQFSCVLYTHRYMVAPISQSGMVCVSMAE